MDGSTSSSSGAPGSRGRLPDAPTPSEASRRLLRTSSADALSGDPNFAAIASAAAGIVQATLLLPINTVQTQMQTAGRGFYSTVALNFQRGALSGVHNLYRSLGPTVLMLGTRQGLKFGGGAAFKTKLPTAWPEALRDVTAGAASAMATTTLTFPLDTLKTRWQTGLPAPSMAQCYYGWRPAVLYSTFGMGLWVVGRNWLERTIPEPASPAWRMQKHLLTGALAGVLVQLPTFPFDTLKKRLQASKTLSRTVGGEVRELLREGGPMRFYRGFALKCGFVALNGAIFNGVYVAVRRLLNMHSD
jgi:hypothetical protein